MLSLPFLYCVSVKSTNKQTIRALKGSGNKSKHRLSFNFFCKWRVAERKKFCRFEQRPMLKKKIYL